MVKVKESPSETTDALLDKQKNLVLFNDDFISFDFVIETLIDVCEHTLEQAETCTWIVHYKGKCAVKSGSANELKPVFQEFSNRNLTASIE